MLFAKIPTIYSHTQDVWGEIPSWRKMYNSKQNFKWKAIQQYANSMGLKTEKIPYSPSVL